MSGIRTDLIQKLLGKEAYAPPAPPSDPAAAGGVPMTDQAMAATADPAAGGMPPAGAPPMDPAMMAGAMPAAPMPGGMPVPGMPMDPMMDPMAGGGVPPVPSPEEMAALGLDPSMGGGAPPEEGAAEAETVKVDMEDLRAILQEAAGGGGEEGGGELAARVDQLEDTIAAIADAAGIEVPGEGAPMPEEAPAEAPAAAAPEGPASVPPDFSLLGELPPIPGGKEAKERVMAKEAAETGLSGRVEELRHRLLHSL